MRIKWIASLILVFACASLQAGINPLELNQLAKNQGLFFFFSSSCPYCQKFSPIVKQVSQRYQIKVVAISMDGGYLPDFPDAVIDEGQAKIFKITMYPSLFLVDPQKERAILVTEGALGEADLTNRLLKIRALINKEEGL